VTSSDFTSLSPFKRLNFDYFHRYADDTPWLLVDFRYAPPGKAATQTQADSGSAVTYLPKVIADRLHIPLSQSAIQEKPAAGVQGSVAMRLYGICMHTCVAIG